MSYTMQKIEWEKCVSSKAPIGENTFLEDQNSEQLVEDDNKDLAPKVTTTVNTIMDEYGDVKRPNKVTITARWQPHEEVIKSSYGKEVLTKSYFYVDPKVEPNAYNIQRMDKLNGETIETIYEMVDLFGRVKLIRFTTV